MWTDAPADAQDGLNKERGLHQAAIEKVRGRVEMADVVALELETSTVAAARPQDLGDVLERVLEQARLAGRQVRLLPVPAPRLVTGNHFVQAEVHRPHVQRRHFRLKL
jgi:hypothetical protein